ncbi:TolC family protein [Acinetobacter terrae]|uniref:TolC family protein n=1 Tax=Acinetobacter terrae TaxID=2731247 RepID=A0A8E4FCJ0_9GAMM|nr:TolC family protein [Acinetobacter terrae]NNH39600.1 TolC family protein [Acinetobacter terrae]NNH88504.1 TolC family protein [Acinetobacter terrae]
MLLNLTWAQENIDQTIRTIIKIALLSSATLYATTTLAQSISYAQAEQSILKDSYSTQANLALQQASQLEAEAVKGLGLPRVDLNVRAYAFHNEVDIPLDSFKNNLEQTLSQGINDRVNQQNLPSIIADPLKEGLNQTIHSGIGLFPDSANVILEDQVIRPTVSVLMPLYTGGLTSSAKEVASIKAQRSQLNTQQQQDLQRFELIQAYFNAQLQKQLLDSSRSNFNAMQAHYNNALELERQGFISKGQRMQFEVAKNNAQRIYQNAEANLRSSLFQLNNLLQSSQITELSTPLFVNSTQSQSLNSLLKTYQDQSSLIRKMQMDTQLANANVKAQSAAKKPNLFAFGEYSLDEKQNWIVGVVARYNLFSGVDKNKNIQAAELQRYASELMTERSKQEIENIIYKSYSEVTTAQQSHQLLQQNMKAAQENLRIQTLSFKEDMGTATQVVDAQNALTGLKSEMALNAYKYVMSLAALLQSHGSINQFQSYVNQAQTNYIR